MSDIINKREFVRHAGKYLIPDKSYILKGNPNLLVIITLSDKKQLSDNKVSDIKPLSDKPKETVNKFTPNYMKDNSSYGCGCKKTDSNLCSKHNRI